MIFLWQDARKSSRTSRSRVDDDGGDGTFRGIMIGCLGFSDEGVYMGGRLTPGSPVGPTPPPGAPGGTRAARWCGGSTAPLRLSFGLRVHDGKIFTGVFVPCNSENIFLCRISETKNSRKQETDTGHLVNRLVQENVKK